jgi:predicted nucleic acid-binding protein
VLAEFSRRLDAIEIATCDPVQFELLWSERDARDIADVRVQLDSLPNVVVGQRQWKRALDVMELLGARGPLHHRQIGILDLLIAATAELAEIPVLHYDHHFEVIASVTGQPVRALAPLGSL